MIFLKGGIGAKIVLIVLGLGVSAGGIAVGARYHAAHHPPSANQRLFVGRITAIAGDAITVHALNGATVTVHIIPRTIIRHAGKTIARTDLHVGDTVLLRVTRTRAGVITALSLGQLKRAPTTQGP
ncbi:MAG: hypothetical protein H0X24_20230 [Ktedonobacterales bacterium]|nr:hypothetical protein [Ktedonobacterales bacterium]